jgi:hypothetical protein
MRKYIYGGHVAEYMEAMEEEEPEKYKTHFKTYLANDIEADADALEEMYAAVRTFELLFTLIQKLHFTLKIVVESHILWCVQD